MNKTFNVKTIATIGVVVALSMVLDYLKLYKLPNGGSITLGAMLPIILLAYLYGTRAAVIAGFIVGMLNLLIDPYIIHPIQLIMDYPLPCMALGLAGLFKRNKFAGATIAIVLKFIIHVLSGVIFFAEYAGDMNPTIYSIMYNGTFMLPNLIICLVILAFLPIDRIKKAIRA